MKLDRVLHCYSQRTKVVDFTETKRLQYMVPQIALGV